jgi:hypothetical protein
MEEPFVFSVNILVKSVFFADLRAIIAVYQGRVCANNERM